MTTPDDQRRVVAALRLSGPRFEQKGMPADALVEVAALEDLIRALMKVYWQDRNPDRKRIPKGYEASITLRLTEIGPGSAVPVLEHPAGVVQPNLFGGSEVGDDYTRALEAIEQYIYAAAYPGRRPPADLRRVPPNKVRKFGATMQRGDGMQISSAVPQRREDWDFFPQLTTENRVPALRTLLGSFSRPVVVQGRVQKVELNLGRIVIRDRTLRGGDIAVPYESGLGAQVDDVDQVFVCRAEGVGDFGSDGTLSRLSSVSNLSVDDVTQDIAAVTDILNGLKDLKAGWLDGESGNAVSGDAVWRARLVLDATVELGNVTRTVAPTEDGGVGFFWPDLDNQLSVEVDPDGSLYIHAADLAAGTFQEQSIPTLGADLVEVLTPWLRAGEDDD